MLFKTVAKASPTNWLYESNTNFEKLLPLVDTRSKSAKSSGAKQGIFDLYSMGVSTNRDGWVYDFNALSLRDKVLFFADTYNETLLHKSEPNNLNIKWSSTLSQRFHGGKRIVYNDANRMLSIYRPFVTKHYFADQVMNDRLTKKHYMMFGSDLEDYNRVIWYQATGARRPFAALATDGIADLHLFMDGTQCLPLYRYAEDGERVCNITEWGLRRFLDHYGERDRGITAERIFAYTYAVLHDPAYREKYQVDLLREFPRLPLYDDFDLWADMGQELLDLHIGFERAELYGLERRDANREAGKARLRADKERGVIMLDERTTLAGVPASAWEYRLGSRSALEWVLDQYKEKKPRDPTIRERFNTYRFADHKEKVIDLLQRVCTVSVRTVEIVEQMRRIDAR